MSEDHAIRYEGIDYDVDQPMGWLVKCECGDEFTHCAPEGARDAHALHREEMRDSERPLTRAMLVALHKRHVAPIRFDSRAEDCLTCGEDAAIAVAVANSPAALQTAIAVVNVEGEKYLGRERWKKLREILVELERAAS